MPFSIIQWPALDLFSGKRPSFSSSPVAATIGYHQATSKAGLTDEGCHQSLNSVSCKAALSNSVPDGQVWLSNLNFNIFFISYHISTLNSHMQLTATILISRLEVCLSFPSLLGTLLWAEKALSECSFILPPKDNTTPDRPRSANYCIQAQLHPTRLNQKG